MTIIEREALVPFSAQTMFVLVDEAERYPARFDWCRNAQVTREDATHYTARLDVGLGAFTTWFRTRNTTHAPERIDMQLVDGPFKSLAGSWRFTALSPTACKVMLRLEFEANSLLLAPAVAFGLQGLADRMVDDFIRAAKTDAAHHAA